MISEIHQPGDPVADILFNWLPFFALIAVTLLAGYFMWLGFRTFVKSALLRKYGVAGQALVTEKWVKSNRARQAERNRTPPVRYHFVTVEMEAGGRRYSSTEVAPIEIWEAVNTGDPVDVVYVPTRSLMRLSSWSHGIGQSAGVLQMSVGAVAFSIAFGVFSSSAWEAYAGTNFLEKEPDWGVTTAKIQGIYVPADPFLRLFAPEKRMIHVVFGDTNDGALAGNDRLVLVSPAQIAGLEQSAGTRLNAWVDPENEFNAILDLERAPEDP